MEIDELYDDSFFPDYEFIHEKKCRYTVVTYTPCEILSIHFRDRDIFS